MIRPIKSDVIDNRSVKMRDVLNSYLPGIERLDVSTGYFDMGGYAAVRERLEEALERPGFGFRLLMGTNAIKDQTPKTFEEAAGAAPLPDTVEDTAPLSASLAEMRLSDGQAAINGLRAILDMDAVQVRYSGTRFNHSKCYILGGDAAIIGSSNFTRPGLGDMGRNAQYNYELNASLKQELAIKNVQEWFDDIWGASDDAKQDMICALERSKFGDPPAPFEVYVQMVFEKYKQRFMDSVRASEDVDAMYDLAPFQTEAVLNAVQIMNDWGGVLISDSVGLGKTHIGLEIIRRKIGERRRVLLVAPRQVLETVWKPKLKETQFNVQTVGMEEMGRAEFAEHIHEYGGIDTILVDESHGFRSGASNRHRNMMKLVTVKQRQVVLMSATPYNNTLLDIYNQLLILAGGDERLFADLGIPHMGTHFKKIIQRGSKRALEGVQPILEAVMVRRTREYIKGKHPEAKLGGREIRFPERRYAPIRYSMPFGGIYKEVTETILDLHMTPYGLERYNTTLTPTERRNRRGVAHLQHVLLVKRFESSVKAISTSLERMKLLYDTMFRIFDGGRMISRKDLRDIMAKWNRLESSGREDGSGAGRDEERMFCHILKEAEARGQTDTSDYDMDAVMEHMKHDIGRLGILIGHINKMLPFDRKFDAVAERILADGALDKDGRKVLIFTEYTDTAKHVHKKLQKKFPKHEIRLLTGSMKRSERPRIIQMFAPKANGAGDAGVEERADILVSTEVLAEGQNLQDCNYIINYDLPWNPVRIVQRVGRLDRLTSEWDVLRSRQCFPEEQLNEQVDLKGIVLSKVQDISRLGLLDMDLLGVGADPKQFAEAASRLEVIAGSDVAAAAGVWRELEAEADFFPKSSYLDMLKKYANREFVNRMSREPLGRRSGILRPGEPQVAVLAYRHGKSDFHTVVYEYDQNRAEVVEFGEAFSMGACAEGTATHLPMDAESSPRASFHHMARIDKIAREAIAKRSGQDRMKAERSNKADADMNKNVKKAMRMGILSEADAEFIRKLVISGRLKPWYRDMEHIMAEPDRGAMQKLVETLRRSFGANENGSSTARRTRINPDDLVLVGTVFAMDEEFDPGIYWSG